MSPKQRYYNLIDSGRFETNPEQIRIIELLDSIYYQLQPRFMASRITKQLHRMFNLSYSKPVKGLYLYGGVGIGKTWLMDIFYNCLPEGKAMRMHFHRFMERMHQELKLAQGEKNPLVFIAKRLAKQIQVLCLDEFFVLDIADAMILKNILKALFNEGITIITTSNIVPDELYKHGISRENFIPAIKLIKKYLQVVPVANIQDYRLLHMAQQGSYFWPLHEATRQNMRDRFKLLCGEQEIHEYQDLIIQGRAIATVRYSQEVAWFRFQDLCHSPRSQLDYIALTRQFHTIFLSSIPAIQPHEDNAIHYFISLIDVLYDANVKLIASADVPIEQIYLAGKMQFQFERTKSRLYEMQTLVYWQKPVAAKTL